MIIDMSKGSPYLNGHVDKKDDPSIYALRRVDGIDTSVLMCR